MKAYLNKKHRTDYISAVGSWVVEPTVIVTVFLVIHYLFGIPVDKTEKLFMLFVFAVVLLLIKPQRVCDSWQDVVKYTSSRVLLSWVLATGITVLLGTLTETLQVIPSNILLAWLIVTPIILVPVQVLNAILLHKAFVWNPAYAKSIIVVGTSSLGIRLAREIANNNLNNMNFKGFFEDRSLSRLDESDKRMVKGQLKDVVPFVKENRINTVYIGLPIAKQERILNLLEELRDTTASVYFLPDIFIYDLIQARFDTVNGIPVIAVCESPFFGANALIKRTFDIIFSSLVLLLLAPVLLLIGLAVKFSSPGPVIFRQTRYGLDGQKITIYKFRSMTVCEDGGDIIQASRNDPRFTRIGAFLRKTSLDELPQFINVLQGRMSVVGPRPHAVAHNEHYRKLLPGYMLRHKVKPGITGFAQISGFRGETTELKLMEKRIELDLDYLRCWSLGFDLEIIWKTVLVVFNDVKAY
ncbi:MAG: undecaprenyl-phosphate glucose phosphotransferase [Magnetococcales bacterium]|nr:undecaprenyl-phosphate glucose phosphotransferase [Magnetococcales bacterium]